MKELRCRAWLKLPASRRSLAGLALIASVATANADAGAQTCIGDCNGDGRVEVNELVVGVNIALSAVAITQCPNFDAGQGTVTVDRLVLAVTNALDGCGGTPTPTMTPAPGTATVTPTSGALVSMWTVDNYDVVESDCADVIKDAVRSALEALGSDFTVRQSGDQVEIEGSHGIDFEGTIDADGTMQVQRRLSESLATCDFDVDVDASANLSTSTTSTNYAGAVHFSGFCLEFSDCSIQITARWTRVGGG